MNKRNDYKYVIILIMFDLGFQELIVIFIVALLVFGPKKLPELARTLGKALRDIRHSMSGVKEQIDAEMREIKDPIDLKNSVYKDSDLFKNEPEMYHKEVSDKAGENKKIVPGRHAAENSSKMPEQKTG